MTQVTTIDTLININPDPESVDNYLLFADWITLNTVTKVVHTGRVEVPILTTDNAQICEVKLRDGVAEHMLQQTGAIMDVANTFQHTMRRG